MARPRGGDGGCARRAGRLPGGGPISFAKRNGEKKKPKGVHGPPLESPNTGEFLRGAYVDGTLTRCLYGAFPSCACTLRAWQKAILILMAPWERPSCREGVQREGWASLWPFSSPFLFGKRKGRRPRRTTSPPARRRANPRPRPVGGTALFHYHIGQSKVVRRGAHVISAATDASAGRSSAAAGGCWRSSGPPPPRPPPGPAAPVPG